MKKTILTLITSKITFFLLTSSLILGLNLTPLIADTLHAPPGRTFALLHNNAQDFFFYQSLMNEGANGKWLTSDPYTTESHQPSLIFSYFLWLGKIAHILGLSYAYVYHFLRIVLSIAFLFFVFYFLYFLKVPYPRLAYLFFLFASPFLHTINDNGNLRTAPFMYWWTGMDPIRRIAYLPHHMFGALGLVISIVLIIKYIKIPNRNYLFTLIVLAILLAFIHTPSLFILLIILPPTLIIYLFSNFDFKNWQLFVPMLFAKYEQLQHRGSRYWREKFIGLLGYWIIGLLALFLMVSQTGKGFPWSQYIDWEKRFQFPLYKELLPALGILTPLAVIGVMKAFVSRQFTWILIASWLVIPFIFIPLAPILGLSNIRLIQGVPYLPLAILATLGIQLIISNIEYRNPKQYQNTSLFRASNFGFRIYKNVGSLIYWIIGLLFIIISFPTLSWSFQDQLREYWPIFGNVYFDNRLSQSFAYINQNFPKDTVSLGTFYTGNYLPSFTHTISYIGHSGYTYNIDQKQPLVTKFFRNEMIDEEVRQFLHTTRAQLIFQGPEEKPLYFGKLYPKILKPVYDQGEITLYTLN